MLWSIIFGLLGCFMILVVYVLWARFTKNLPRGLKDFEPCDMPYKQPLGPTRDAYKLRKLPEEIDYIIIGSGISSLYCAALLSRLGHKVVILEQHYVAGGCTHSFEDQGYEFDTGLHYVGRIEKYKPLLDLVSLEDKVEWAKMGCEEDGFCYDEIKIGDQDMHHFRAGKQAWVDELAAKFPDERLALEEYADLVQRVNKLADMYYFAKLFHPWVMKLFNIFVNKEYFKWSSTPTSEVISKMFKAPELRAIICSQYGNYGLEPHESSFLIHSGMAAHYMNGGYFPVGGSQRISECLIPTIQRAGGRVFVKASVESIVVDENGKASGVMMENGDQINSVHGVICGTGIPVTQKLVPEAFRPKLGYDQVLASVSNSLSHIYAFVGLEGTAEELELRGANLWRLPTNPNPEPGHYLGKFQYQPFHVDGDKPWEGSTDQDLLMFIGFPSQKDPSFNERFPGKSTCCIITVAHPKWFEEFESEDPDMNQSMKRKNAAYEACKQKIKERLLAGLYRNFPSTKGQVRHCEIATPLTNMYYLRHHDSYGLEHTPNRYSGKLDSVRPLTEIPGLWITGQDLATVGIVGALNAGILTAHSVVGYGLFDLAFANRNLIEDLMYMDESQAGKKKAL